MFYVLGSGRRLLLDRAAEGVYDDGAAAEDETGGAVGTEAGEGRKVGGDGVVELGRDDFATRGVDKAPAAGSFDRGTALGEVGGGLVAEGDYETVAVVDEAPKAMLADGRKSTGKEAYGVVVRGNYFVAEGVDEAPSAVSVYG